MAKPTDGAASGEPSLLELSRVVTEEGEAKIQPFIFFEAASSRKKKKVPVSSPAIASTR